jgi:hypothetical protein
MQAQASVRKSEVLRSETINGGRDRADLVRDSDTRGNVVVYQVNKTQRMADRLYDQGKLDPKQYDAANQLRDLWEISGISVARVGAAAWGRVSGGDHAHIGNDEAMARYTLAMRQMGRDRTRLLQDVVIGDMHPDVWGRRWRCDALIMLQRALDALARHWGV